MKKLPHLDSAPDSQLISINNACQLLDISRATLYRLVHARKLTIVKVGSSSKLPLGNLRALIGGAA